MLKVPAKYREMAERDAREVSVKVVMGETELTNDDITELSIYRSLGENGFNIGGAVTARVRMVALMKLPYSGEVSMDVFVRFGFDSESCSEYVQLGHFYGHASNPSNKTAQVEIIGYDKLGSSAFNSRCTFAKVGDAELAFPCTVQEMLEYVCKRRGLETEFECLDYTVSEMPVKDKSRDNSDYERYYTYKEIIGFIAAAHGATAAIDSGGSLVFIGAKESSETINSGDCVDFSLTASEAFTVKGILLHVQNTLSTGSTNIFINDDSETAYDGEISEGVIETSCPFGSIEIAEGLWEQLGGFSYSSCEFARRGRGWTELGDIVSAVDNLREKVNGEYIKGKAVVQTVELSFSTDGGFMERVISKAENAEESAERLGTGNLINNACAKTNEPSEDEFIKDEWINELTGETGTIQLVSSLNVNDSTNKISYAYRYLVFNKGILTKIADSPPYQEMIEAEFADSLINIKNGIPKWQEQFITDNIYDDKPNNGLHNARAWIILPYPNIIKRDLYCVALCKYEYDKIFYISDVFKLSGSNFLNIQHTYTWNDLVEDLYSLSLKLPSVQNEIGCYIPSLKRVFQNYYGTTKTLDINSEVVRFTCYALWSYIDGANVTVPQIPRIYYQHYAYYPVYNGDFYEETENPNKIRNWKEFPGSGGLNYSGVFSTQATAINKALTKNKRYFFSNAEDAERFRQAFIDLNNIT